MQDLNTVALVGRLTSDPELRSLASGTSVCSMRVAFNTSQKTAGGEWEDKGNFINVSAWGAHGETCHKYLNKGSKVAINGALQWREWGDPGEKRSEVSITANRVQFLDSKEDRPAQSQTPHTSAVTADDDIPF